MTVRHYIQRDQFNDFFPDFHQEARMRFLSVFGEENLQFAEYNKDIKGKIRWKMLAKRKVFNPFKWVEFVALACKSAAELFFYATSLLFSITTALFLSPLLALYGLYRLTKSNSLNQGINETIAKAQKLFWLVTHIAFVISKFSIEFSMELLRHFIVPVNYFFKPLNNVFTEASYRKGMLLVGFYLAVGITTGGLLLLTGAALLPTLLAGLVGVFKAYPPLAIAFGMLYGTGRRSFIISLDKIINALYFKHPQ